MTGPYLVGQSHKKKKKKKKDEQDKKLTLVSYVIDN